MLQNHYNQQCQQGLIQRDPRQSEILRHFQRVFDQLMETHGGSFQFLKRFRRQRLVRGVYVWGGVGIGKSFMMDCFFRMLPFEQKLRLHFHAFMQYIHHELKKLQGKKNPMNDIAKSLARQYRVICFDEFVVNDIVDAMLLKNLLEALFSHGVCFVATSNTAPDELYKNGLQRTSFLPAIALLKENVEIVHADSVKDYRLRQLQKSGVYFTPDNADARGRMDHIFQMLQGDENVNIDDLYILDRPVSVVKYTSKVVWFEFGDICGIPRSQHDYLEISKQFNIVMLSDIPVFTPEMKNAYTLFIRLIDVLYDARIPVIFSAAAAAENLGVNLSHVADYARTQSRLMEMRSEKYFSHSIF